MSSISDLQNMLILGKNTDISTDEKFNKVFKDVPQFMKEFLVAEDEEEIKIRKQLILLICQSNEEGAKSVSAQLIPLLAKDDESFKFKAFLLSLMKYLLEYDSLFNEVECPLVSNFESIVLLLGN